MNEEWDWKDRRAYWYGSHRKPRLLEDRLYEELVGFGRVALRFPRDALCGALRC